MENSIKSDGLNLSMNTSLTEDMARSLLSVVSSATPEQSPVTTTVVSRPSVVFSSTDDNSGSPLQKLQKQVSKMLKGFSPPPEVRGAYNPEDLTSQKRQWARFQLKSLVIQLLSLSRSLLWHLWFRPGTVITPFRSLLTSMQELFLWVFGTYTSHFLNSHGHAHVVFVHTRIAYKPVLDPACPLSKFVFFRSFCLLLILNF